MGRRSKLTPFTEKALAIVVSAAEAGDDAACSWLRGEGRIVISNEKSARYVRWDEPYSRHDPAVAEWRAEVFKRDGYTCQQCEKRGGKLHAHHIRKWSDSFRGRLLLANGITLCVDCHAEKHPEMANLIRNARYLGQRV